MGHCILRKAGTTGGGDKIPIIDNACQVLYSIKWPDGEPAESIWVNCNANGKWYNKHTDRHGEVLFTLYDMPIAGSAGVNIRNIYGYDAKILDVRETTSTISNIQNGTIQKYELTLSSMAISMRLDKAESGNVCVYNNNFTRIHMKEIGGGGGGSGGLGNTYIYAGYGGGAGRITDTNILPNKVNKLSPMPYTVGIRGNGGEGNTAEIDNTRINPGDSGGTTTIFGYSAIGGTGGAWNRAGSGSAAGARWNSTFWNLGHGQNSPDMDFGGGGGGPFGGGANKTYTGGKPYGGNGGGVYGATTTTSGATDGRYGGGGGV